MSAGHVLVSRSSHGITHGSYHGPAHGASHIPSYRPSYGIAYGAFHGNSYGPQYRKNYEPYGYEYQQPTYSSNYGFVEPHTQGTPHYNDSM